MWDDIQQTQGRESKGSHSTSTSSKSANTVHAMAKTIQSKLLLVVLVLSISLISVSARPCKTLFISTYAFAFRQPSALNPHSPSSSGFVTVFSEITQPSNPVIIPNGDSRPVRNPFRMMPVLPSTVSSYDLSSIRDRTKDILSVVVALLFGVGCGALTSATAYLAWSLFFSRGDYSLSFSSPYDDDSDGNDSVDFSPKKMGYVKISDETMTVTAKEPTKETSV